VAGGAQQRNHRNVFTICGQAGEGNAAAALGMGKGGSFLPVRVSMWFHLPMPHPRQMEAECTDLHAIQPPTTREKLVQAVV